MAPTTPNRNEEREATGPVRELEPGERAEHDLSTGKRRSAEMESAGTAAGDILEGMASATAVVAGNSQHQDMLP